MPRFIKASSLIGCCPLPAVSQFEQSIHYETDLSLLCLCQLLPFGVRNAAEGFVREGTVHGNVLFFLRQHAIYVHVIIIEKI